MNLSIILQLLFWFAVFLIFWAYFGYFLTLKLISLVYTYRVHKEDTLPNVSLVITAYNEEIRIQHKLENTLALDYPKEKLEVIVVSDASTDRTDEIVKSFANSGVKLLVMPKRYGKHYGQGRGIQHTSNELVVLSDATTFLAPDAIRKISSSFADPAIGCVSGQDRIDSGEDKSQGEGVYIRYEMMLRELESKVGSLVGVSGSFFAIRKSLCNEWINNMSSDFYMPILAKRRGFRTVSEPLAIGTYKVLHDNKKEFTRKVRTVVHGLEVLFWFKSILNPFKYGFYSLQMFSHKLCRWFVPFCMIIVLATNLLLLNHGLIYSFALILQLLFYMIVTVGFLFKQLQKYSLVRFPVFFAMVNSSIIVAWYKYMTNQKYLVWDATKR
ncbi:MAG: glycosyltransferase family 2 protein [candidate division Zixibacteria bacterium]|nr:glycosyltransferase family 2 protein [candidate division Zixibacteria bacterium]